MSKKLDLFKCDHGIYADFVNDQTGEKVTVSQVCDLVMGHLGPHQDENGFVWEDDDNSEVIL